MKFGAVANVDGIDFTLPEDHPGTRRILSNAGSSRVFEIYTGCAKWGKTDLRNFYPPHVKDELSYYARQFNSIELNTLYYHFPEPDQVVKWRDRTPDKFRFFPKVTKDITHDEKLGDPKALVERYCNGIRYFEDRLGTVFLQFHERFGPGNFRRLEEILGSFPPEIPLAVELRHQGWFGDEQIFAKYCSLLESLKAVNIIVDSPGRRDLLHMRLTGPVAFVRYVGANHPTDTSRLDDWVVRIRQWREQGLQRLYFFVHQHVEAECPVLVAHFIRKLNETLHTDHPLPHIHAAGNGQLSLF